MFEILAAFTLKQVALYAGGSLAGIFFAWLFKLIPNDKIKLAVGKLMFGAGVAVTLGLSKWKVTAKFWNSIIEAWIIDLIDNVIGHGVQEFIRGLRSDNDN